MIRITYSSDHRPLAEQIRDDLSDSAQLSQPLLIVLVSRQSSADPHVQAEIDQARSERVHIVPILTETIALPADLADWRSLDFSGGYNHAQLLRHLEPSMLRSPEISSANRRALIVIGGIALLMFGIALTAIASGFVAFPVAEYNEEATFQAEWVNGLIRQTLEQVQPRSTEDALNFPATHEAAPTRLFFYIRETATALPNAGSG